MVGTAVVGEASYINKILNLFQDNNCLPVVTPTWFLYIKSLFTVARSLAVVRVFRGVLESRSDFLKSFSF